MVIKIHYVSSRELIRSVAKLFLIIISLKDRSSLWLPTQGSLKQNCVYLVNINFVLFLGILEYENISVGNLVFLNIE